MYSARVGTLRTLDVGALDVLAVEPPPQPAKARQTTQMALNARTLRSLLAVNHGEMHTLWRSSWHAENARKRAVSAPVPTFPSRARTRAGGRNHRPPQET